MGCRTPSVQPLNAPAHMQRGKILALDVATRTGVAEGRPGEVPRLRTINFRGDDKNDLTCLYGRATLWMAMTLRDNPPDLVVIEKPVPPSGAFGHTNADTTLITIGLFGIICGIVHCKSIRLEIAPISTWRKHFIGKGNAPGVIAKQMALDRCRLLGWKPEDHNSAEAGGIWDWAGATFMGKISEALHLFGEKAHG
jgi:hypothetical protein